MLVRSSWLEKNKRESLGSQVQETCDLTQVLMCRLVANKMPAGQYWYGKSGTMAAREAVGESSWEKNLAWLNER